MKHEDMLLALENMQVIYRLQQSTISSQNISIGRLIGMVSAQQIEIQKMKRDIEAIQNNLLIIDAIEDSILNANLRQDLDIETLKAKVKN